MKIQPTYLEDVFLGNPVVAVLLTGEIIEGVVAGSNESGEAVIRSERGINYRVILNLVFRNTEKNRRLIAHATEVYGKENLVDFLSDFVTYAHELRTAAKEDAAKYKNI